MNNYILEYYQKIKSGEIVVGEYILLLYEMIIKGLEDKSFFYDAKKAKVAIVFIEHFVHHHEGALAPKLIKLELWQKALVSIIFGIVDEDGRRHFREIFLVMARKNGKTLFAAAIAEYCTYCDGEYGARIYFAAPKLAQANLCFDAFCNSIGKEPSLARITKKRRTDIYVKESNSTAQPIAFSAKSSDGFNISAGICDEIASWPASNGLRFYEVLKSSQGARRSPLLLSISTAGYVNDGPYDELMTRSSRVLKGGGREKRLLPVLYIIDDKTKWDDINELQKSNPNLGVSVTVDYLLEEIAVAQDSLPKKAEFLTKYCNIKQNIATAWLKAEHIEPSAGEPIDLTQFAECYCVGGIDLSKSTDLTSACVVIEKDGKLNVISHFWLPTEKLQEATARDKLPYDIYLQRGFLSLSGENHVNYKDVFLWFVELVEKYRILPLKVGYDRYSSTYLVDDMKEYGFHMDDVFQGFNLSGVLREFEGILKDGRITIGNNALLKAHFYNSAIKTEVEQDRWKLVKLSPTDHIDGMAALIDALTVRQKYNDEIGAQLKNKR